MVGDVYFNDKKKQEKQTKPKTVISIPKISAFSNYEITFKNNIFDKIFMKILSSR